MLSHNVLSVCKAKFQELKKELQGLRVICTELI